MNVAVPVAVRAGDVLMTEGSPGDSVQVTLEGEFEITKRSGSSDVVLARRGPGVIFGEMTLLDGSLRTASVRALRDGRVLVISHGKVIYDGALAKITDMFGQSKLVKLHFDGDGVPDNLERFGEISSREGPVVALKVERTRVSEVLATILDRHTVIDVSVQDPPLDQIIARVFEEAGRRHEASHPSG